MPQKAVGQDLCVSLVTLWRAHILTNELECDRWLRAPGDEIEAIQARETPFNVLQIVSDEEAAQYVGGYLR
jgi:hypothetical protein